MPIDTACLRIISHQVQCIHQQTLAARPGRIIRGVAIVDRVRVPEVVILFRLRGISQSHGGLFVWVRSFLPVDAPESEHFLKLAEHPPASQRQESEARFPTVLKWDTF